MNGRLFGAGSLARAVLCLAALACPHATAGAETEAERVAKSTLIFRGTVVRLQAVTTKLVAASPRTIVVRIDSVIRTTDLGAERAGTEVTLQVKDPSKFKVGDRAIFYTRGWLLADGVALIEVDHKPIPLSGAASASLLSTITAASQAEGNKLLQVRVDGADLVVEGRVVSTERVDVKPPAGGGGRPRPISEHAPRLKKATIEVQSFIKGTAPKVVTVLYPASQDVSWLGAPKFERGDTGVFILSRAEKSIELKDYMKDLKLAPEEIQKNFVGPNPLDFQQKLDPQRVRDLINKTRLPRP